MSLWNQWEIIWEIFSTADGYKLSKSRPRGVWKPWGQSRWPTNAESSCRKPGSHLHGLQNQLIHCCKLDVSFLFLKFWIDFCGKHFTFFSSVTIFFLPMWVYFKAKDQLVHVFLCFEEEHRGFIYLGSLFLFNLSTPMGFASMLKLSSF